MARELRASLTAEETGVRPVSLFGPLGERRRVRIGREEVVARLLPLVTVAIAFGSWEVIGRIPSLSTTLPPFSTVAGWLFDHLATGDFWSSVGATVAQWAVGLVLGAAAGILLGLVIGFSEPLRLLLDAVVEFLRPIPFIVYLPLLLLLYGNTYTLAMVNVALGVVWILLFQTYYGCKDINPLLFDTCRVFGLSRTQRLRRLVLPSVMPYVATGIRIASSTAFLIAVSVELIGGSPGLGLQIGQSQSNSLYPAMYGYTFFTGLLAVAVNNVLVRAERRGLRWHPSQRAVERGSR